MKRTQSILFCLSLLLLAAGCASHPNKMASIRTAISNPTYVVNTNSSPFSESQVTGRNKILFLAERARAFQLAGDHENSTRDYLAAEAAYDAQDEEPVVSISTTAGKTGAMALNDLVLPYEGNPHERLMLFQLDAFNHLVRHDWNTTRAAVNNIVYLSEKERQRREERVRAAEEAAEKDGRFKFSALTDNSVFKSHFSMANSISGALEDALQNGYAYYFSAFVKEVDNDPSGALIGYRRAAALAPANTFVKRDIHRMEVELGREEALPGDETKPNVVVFFEEGFAPELTSFDLGFTTLPVKHTAHNVSAAVGGVSTGTRGGGVTAAIPVSSGLTPISFKFSLPYYSAETLGAVPSLPLVVSAGGLGTLAETQLVGDFRALAARAYAERLPYVATRAAFRAIFKTVATSAASEAARQRGNQCVQVFVWLGGFLYTQASEQPDLRSWLLAPRYGQVARFHCPPGRQKLTFSHNGNSRTFMADVPSDGMLIIHAISVPGRLVVEGTGLDFN